MAKLKRSFEVIFHNCGEVQADVRARAATLRMFEALAAGFDLGLAREDLQARRARRRASVERFLEQKRAYHVERVVLPFLETI